MTPRNMFHRNRADRPVGVRNAHGLTAAAANSNAGATRTAGIVANGVRRFASLPRDGAARRPA
jgi:hypothetical protein